MVTVARSKADTYSDKDSHSDIVINVTNLLPYKYKQRFQNELLEGVGPNILSVLRDKNSLVYNRLEGAWNFLVPTQSHVLSNDSSPQTIPLDDTATTGHVISLLKIGSTVYQERYNEESKEAGPKGFQTQNDDQLPQLPHQSQFENCKYHPILNSDLQIPY